MKQTTWIIQEVTWRSSQSLVALKQTLSELEYQFVEIRVVPFSEVMPEIPADIDLPVIFYGYNTLIQNAARHDKWKHGLFFDPAKFDTSTYTKILGDRMLNADAELTTCKGLFESDLNATDQIFIRPNDDTKLFSGQLMTFRDYWRWYEKLDDPENIQLNPDMLVLWSRPKVIKSEYRTYILDGKVIGASQYLPVFAQFTPPEVISFAEEIAAQYSPSIAFVCDIACTDKGLKVIEFNCINGSSFYQADISVIVRALSTWKEGADIHGLGEG
jgi:hypothetical protein